MSEEREWSDLPGDVLRLISKKLPDLSDFIRFRAVCPSWCSSAPLSDRRSLLPWLLNLYQDYDSLQEELRFFSLSTGETGVIHVKESHRGKVFDGPCCGNLLIHQEGNRDVLVPYNPVTNTDMAPITPQIRSGKSRESYTICRKDMECCYWRHDFQSIFYCHYWNGLFISLSVSEDTRVFDATSLKLLYKIPTPNIPLLGVHTIIGSDPKCYIVELSGVVMRVLRFLRFIDEVEQSTFQFSKLKFDGRNGQPSWVDVSNIGDHMLFLNRFTAFSVQPIAGFKGNCVYLYDRQGRTPCRYDIATGTFSRVPCPFEHCTWFLPSLL